MGLGGTEERRKRDGERDEEEVTSAKARLPLTEPLLALKRWQTRLINSMRTPPEVNHGLEFSVGVCAFVFAKTQRKGGQNFRLTKLGSAIIMNAFRGQMWR